MSTDNAGAAHQPCSVAFQRWIVSQPRNLGANGADEFLADVGTSSSPHRPFYGSPLSPTSTCSMYRSALIRECTEVIDQGVIDSHVHLRTVAERKLWLQRRGE